MSPMLADAAPQVRKKRSPACPVCHEAGGNPYCTGCGTHPYPRYHVPHRDAQRITETVTELASAPPAVRAILRELIATEPDPNTLREKVTALHEAALELADDPDYCDHSGGYYLSRGRPLCNCCNAPASFRVYADYASDTGPAEVL